MPTGTQTHQSPAYTARTISADSPTALSSPYAAAYSAADLSAFPSGGVKNTNTIEELRKNLNQLASDFNTAIVSHQSQITKNDGDISEIDVNLTEHAEDLSAIATDLSNKAWDTIVITAGIGLDGTGNLQADRTINLLTAKDGELGGILSNTNQTFGADGNDQLGAGNEKKGPLDIDSSSGKVTVKDYSLELGVKTHGNYVKTLAGASGGNITVTNGAVNNGGAAEVGLTSLITAATKGAISDEEEAQAYTHTSGKIRKVLVPQITYNQYGQLTVVSELEVNSANNKLVTVTAGNHLTDGGNFFLNNGVNQTVTLNHAAVSVQSDQTFTSSSPANSEVGHREVEILSNIGFDAYGHVDSISKQNLTYGLNSPLSSGYTGSSSFDMQIPRESDFQDLRTLFSQLQGDTISLGVAGNTVIVDRKFDFRKDVLISTGADLNVDDDTLFVDAGNDRVGINLGTGVTPSSTLHVGGTIKGVNDFFSDGTGTNGDPGDQNARFNGYGIQGHRDEAFYMSNAGTGSIKFGIGGIHGAATKMTLTSSGELSTTGSITAIGQIIAKSTNPSFKLFDTSNSPTGGDSTTTGYNQTNLTIGNDHTFEIQTRDGDGTFVSNDYRIEKDSTGSTEHQFKIANSNRLTITDSTTTVTGLLTASSTVTGGSLLSTGSIVGLGNLEIGSTASNKLIYNPTNQRLSIGATSAYDVGFATAGIFLNSGTIGAFGTNTARKLILQSDALNVGGANIELYSGTWSEASQQNKAYYDASKHFFRKVDATHTALTIDSDNSFVGINATSADATVDLDGRTYGPYKFQVDGDAKLKGNVNITGNLNVTGISSTGSSATVEFNQVDLDEVGGISMNGIFTNTLTTDATSSADGGANTLSGGLAVTKKLYVGSNLHISGNIYADGTIQAANGNFDVDASGNISDVGSIVAGGTIRTTSHGGLVVDVADDGTAPLDTAVINLIGFEGRAAGIYIKDSLNSAVSANDREWFAGSGYLQSTFMLGYAADGIDTARPAQTKFVVDTDGKVGIGGVTAPTALLDVTDTTVGSAKVLVKTTGAGQAGYDLQNSEGHFRLITDAGVFRIYDQTDSKERLAIDTDGKVGIGLTNPDAQLHLKGDFENNIALKIEGTFGTGKSHYFRTHGNNSEDLALYSDSTRVMDWNSTEVESLVKFKVPTIESDSIGIGVTTPAEALDVQGTVRIRGTAGTFASSGDSSSYLNRKEYLQFPAIDKQAAGDGTDGARLYAENSKDSSATTNATDYGSLVLDLCDNSSGDHFVVRHTTGTTFRNNINTSYNRLGLMARTAQNLADNDLQTQSGSSADTDYALDMTTTRLILFKTDSTGALTDSTGVPGLNNTDQGFSFNHNSGSPFFMFSRKTNACGGFNVNADSSVLDFYRSGVMQATIKVGTADDRIFSITTRRANSATKVDRYKISRNGSNVFENALFISGNATAMDITPDAVLSLKSTKTGTTDVGDHIRFESSGGGSLHAIKASSSGLEIRTTATAAAAKNIKLQPGGSSTVAQFNSSNITFSQPIVASGDLTIDTNGMVYDQSRRRLGIGTASPSGHYANGEGIDIVAPDTEVAELRLMGTSQGTGRIYVGQSGTHGGGFLYNGDNNPSVVGSEDEITFFRKSASTTQISGTSRPEETGNSSGGAEHRVFSYHHDSNHVKFQGTVTNNIKTTTANGAFTIYLGDSNVHVINVSGNSTMTLSANSTRDTGGAFTMIIKNAGSYDIDFPSNMHFAGGDPTLTPGPDGVDILSGVYVSGIFYAAITYDLQPS